MRWPVSGSIMERVDNCAPSVLLSQCRTNSAIAGRGTAIHGYLAEVRTLGQEEALARVPEEHRLICELLDVPHLPVNLAAEVAIAYDYRHGTARELGRGLGRQYGELGPDEIPMTLDVLGVADGSVYVGDYKSGFVPVAPASRNAQVRLGGLAAARLHGAEHATIEIIALSTDGEAYRDTAELDAIELDAVAEQVRATMARVEQVEAEMEFGAVPTVTQGLWCRYCPALPACPGMTGLVRHIADLPATLTPEVCADAWHKLKLVRIALDRIEAVVRDFAATTPLDLGNGNVLAMAEVSSEKLDPRVVCEVLEAREVDREVLDEAVSLSTSKAALQRALKMIAPPRGLAPLVREVMAQVAERGGVKTIIGESVRERRWVATVKDETGETPSASR